MLSLLGKDLWLWFWVEFTQCSSDPSKALLYYECEILRYGCCKKKNPVLFNLMVGTLPSIAPANQETFSFISYGGKKGQLLL